MKRPFLVVPAIDLRAGRCVRLVQGSFASATVFPLEPAEQARRFRDAGVRMIHVVDLDAAEGKGLDNRAAIAAIRAAVTCALEVGGGVRSDDDARRLVDLGIERIVVGTVLAASPRTVGGWVDRFGRRFVAGIDAVRAVRPTLKTMFHIAPNLYATNKPDARWFDSRLIGPDGKQTVYAYNYESSTYFTKERLAENWRWWSYYPAVDNSYGQALLDSVDVMMDQMGASGVFVDGALWDYGGAYSYDRFDGHTADIDRPLTYEQIADYFRALGLRPLRGREFTTGEAEAAQILERIEIASNQIGR